MHSKPREVWKGIKGCLACGSCCFPISSPESFRRLVSSVVSWGRYFMWSCMAMYGPIHEVPTFLRDHSDQEPKLLWAQDWLLPEYFSCSQLFSLYPNDSLFKANYKKCSVDHFSLKDPYRNSSSFDFKASLLHTCRFINKYIVLKVMDVIKCQSSY